MYAMFTDKIEVGINKDPGPQGPQPVGTSQPTDTHPGTAPVHEVYMYTLICICVILCAYIAIYTYICIDLCLDIYICIHIYICIYIYTYIYTYMYIYTYICCNRIK
jgi:hypothetical protein